MLRKGGIGVLCQGRAGEGRKEAKAVKEKAAPAVKVEVTEEATKVKIEVKEKHSEIPTEVKCETNDEASA